MQQRPELFPSLFETRIARTAEDVWVCRHVRYLAYCQDRSHFDAAAYPDRAEEDQDDERSVHALLTYRPTGAPIGAVRLILPPGKFPVERVSPIDLARCEPSFPRSAFAEISRLCMTERYLDADAAESSALRELRPYAILGLLRGLVLLSREYDVRVWCGMMGAGVVRGAGLLGVRFQRIGRPVRLGAYGIKQPILGKVDEVLERMRKHKPELWGLVAHGGLDRGDLETAVACAPSARGRAPERLARRQNELVLAGTARAV